MVYIKTMTVEQQGKHKRAIFIPVKGRPGYSLTTKESYMLIVE